MNNADLPARIAAINAMILAYETAISEVASGAQSYRLDTGQNVVVVTKSNLEKMVEKYESLLNLCSVLTARLNGQGNNVYHRSFG
jgi:nitrate reductase NapAB chaperone NapD